MSARILVLGVTVGALACGSAARAEGRADTLFGEGTSAYQAGDFARAAKLFGEAHALDPSASKKFNEAQSLRRAGMLAIAAEAYEAALSLDGLSADDAALGKRKLSELRSQLGILIVEAPPGTTVSVAHVEQRKTPLRIYLEPGKHRLHTRSRSGVVSERLLEIVANGTERIAMSKAAPPPPSRPRPEAPSQVQWPLGWSILGLGAAGGIAAAILGARFVSVLDDYEAGNFVDTELESEALSLRIATNVVAFASGIIGATGIVLIITAPSDTTQTDLSLTVGPEGTRATLRW